MSCNGGGEPTGIKGRRNGDDSDGVVKGSGEEEVGRGREADGHCREVVCVEDPEERLRGMG
jgi:hypothetical protein